MKLPLVILTSILAFTLPNLSLGQAPNLGTASNYALFTVTGAFSNINQTMVKGHIGTNAGELTGFPPGIIMGETHIVDTFSQQTAADVVAAYNELTAASCTAPISASIGGQTLTPGVYCQSAAASASDLTGTLTLDGQGNPNAVFIIKLNGALSTATGSNIVLINDASLENIYFQVDGAVNLGIGSMFKGTIIANGAISLLTGAHLQGRGLSIAGAINLDGNLINIAPDLTPSVFSNGGTYNANEQKDVIIAIFNVGPGATTGSVTFEINKLAPAFTLTVNPNATTTNVTSPAVTMPPTVNNSEWTFTEQATRYVVTLKDGFSIPAGSNKKIVIQVTATSTPNAAATITARVFNGTGGGETPTTNNGAVYLISINDSNN